MQVVDYKHENSVNKIATIDEELKLLKQRVAQTEQDFTQLSQI